MYGAKHVPGYASRVKDVMSRPLAVETNVAAPFGPVSTGLSRPAGRIIREVRE